MALGIWEVAKSSFKGQLGDQYLEFFECPSLGKVPSLSVAVCPVVGFAGCRYGDAGSEHH